MWIKCFRLDYQGTTPIELALKVPETGTKMVVMGYGYLPGAYLASQWIVLPEGKVVNDRLIVDLTMPFTPGASQGNNLIVSLEYLTTHRHLLQRNGEPGPPEPF
jgi:hypothetical protein